MKFFIILIVCSSISLIGFCQSKNQSYDISSQNSRRQIIHNVSDIDTVCNFDPIAVGNRWIYKGAITHINPTRVDSFYCFKEVLQETQINKETYKAIINNWSYVSFRTIEYERIDTATGMIYLLDNNNNEFPADSLHAQPGDYYYASRTGYTGNDFSGRRNTNFDSSNDNSNRYYNTTFYIPGYGRTDKYILTYGVGISFWYMIQGGQAVYLTDVTIALKGCIVNGIVYGDTTYYKYTDIRDNYTVKEFNLSQNYPNPFNPATKIKYSLEKGGNVSLKIYDILGREIETLVNRYEGPGNYEVEFAPKSLSDGVYIYRLQAGDNYLLKKMIYLK